MVRLNQSPSHVTKLVSGKTVVPTQACYICCILSLLTQEAAMVFLPHI
jgi:hypothetical protein